MPLTHIDCFAGPGGICTGLHAAGFETKVAIEYIKSCVETYSYNHPEVHVIHSDIRKVTAEQILPYIPSDGVDLEMCIRDSSYPVNQVDGFELTIEKPTWSPFKGYTIRWAVTANSKEIYSFGEDGSPGFEYLERHIDGQWYRLTYSQDIFPFNNLEFSLGGDSTGLQGSIV